MIMREKVATVGCPMTRHHRVHLALLAAASVLGWAGCSPLSDAERAYQEARQREAERRETIRSSLDGGTEESAAIEMARESPATGGEGTTEKWVERQLAQSKGSVLFPHWQARRYGISKYEVSFTYALMNELGEVEKKGYAWKVDVVLKVVSPGRVLTAAELGAGTTRPAPRRRRTVPPPDIQLEE